jgi:hypothetical protein
MRNSANDIASAKTESFGRLTLNSLVKPPSLLGGDEPGVDGMDGRYRSSPLLM